MKLVKVSDTLLVWQSEKPTRNKSYLCDIDLAEHCPDFWAKCFDIESNWEPDNHDTGKYCQSQLRFVKSVLEFYDDWSYITWKQYDSIMRMRRGDQWYRSRRVASNNVSLNQVLRALGKFIPNDVRDEDDVYFAQKLRDGTTAYLLPTEESMDRLFTDVASRMFFDR